MQPFTEIIVSDIQPNNLQLYLNLSLLGFKITQSLSLYKLANISDIDTNTSDISPNLNLTNPNPIHIISFDNILYEQLIPYNTPS